MGTIKEHTHEIDGITYKTRTFPATQALTLGARIARLVVVESWQALLGVDFSKLDRLFKGEAIDLSKEGEVEGEGEEQLRFAMVLLDGFISAAKVGAPEEFAALAKDLLERTECDNIATSGAPGPVKAHFDSHFAGRLDHLGKVVFWAAHMGFTSP